LAEVAKRSNIFVQHGVRHTKYSDWLNRETMFDQTSDKVRPHNAFWVLLLKKYVYITQIPFLIGCFFLLMQSFLAGEAKQLNILWKAKH